jgi:catechol 2,3-dioxygenase-like lactoylglutathione lyase family enzyme
MPEILRVLETALYADNLDTVVAFYRDVLGLRVLDSSSRLVSMDAGQGSVLLLFHRGETTAGLETPGGRIPPHDGQGPVHLAFAIRAGTLGEWEGHLERHEVPIESRVRWQGGGESVYFRDPEGHSVELVTPGTWPVY